MHPYAWPHAWGLLFVVPPLVGAYVVAARLYPPSRVRIAAFSASQVLLVVTFATPLETIALHYLLSAHLLQNVVTAEWAPGLAVFGLAPAFARDFERYAPVRALTQPLVALPLWLGTYFAWHIPWIYDRALENPRTVLHLEHTTYFVAGALMWWPVVHGRWSDGVKAVYLFAAFVLASPLGLLLALLPRPAYAFYAHAPRLWGIGRLLDQQIAGLTMAVEQAVVFFAVFTVYLQRFLRRESIAGAFSETRR